MIEQKHLINNKTNSELLINYLEPLIADEMLLNNFIRSIEIVYQDDFKVVIDVKSEHSLELLSSPSYFIFIKNGIKDIYESNLSIDLAVGWSQDGHTTKVVLKAESKYLSDKYTFDNYIGADFNYEVINMANAVIKSPGKFSPLFITSKSGLGKTHLLHAVGNKYTNNSKTVMYVEPNKFTKKIVDFSKIGGSTIGDYIETLKSYDVLLFDDIQNLGDRNVTLKVLFNILNEFIEDGKQIIIVSDKAPSELSGFEERFITRFSSGLTTNISEPSIDDLIKILQFKLREQNLSPNKWEEEALKFIARNNSHSIRSIEGAVKRVSYFIGDASNIKYTYNVISNIFKELSVDIRELTPSRIISFVANYYKIQKTLIIGKTRKSEVIIARHMAIWLVRNILNLPYVEIGRIFGNRDHTTIMSSIKNIDQKMEMNIAIKAAANSIEKKIKSMT